LLKENDLAKLKDRVSKAIDYFSKTLPEELLKPIDSYIDSLKGVKKIKKHLKQIRQLKQLC
jgi:hypothetical protein